MGYLTDGEVEERSDKDAAVQMLLDVALDRKGKADVQEWLLKHYPDKCCKIQKTPDKKIPLWEIQDK